MGSIIFGWQRGNPLTDKPKIFISYNGNEERPVDSGGRQLSGQLSPRDYVTFAKAILSRIGFEAVDYADSGGNTTRWPDIKKHLDEAVGVLQFIGAKGLGTIPIPNSLPTEMKTLALEEFGGLAIEAIYFAEKNRGCKSPIKIVLLPNCPDSDRNVLAKAFTERFEDNLTVPATRSHDTLADMVIKLDELRLDAWAVDEKRAKVSEGVAFASALNRSVLAETLKQSKPIGQRWLYSFPEADKLYKRVTGESPHQSLIYANGGASFTAPSEKLAETAISGLSVSLSKYMYAPIIVLGCGNGEHDLKLVDAIDKLFGTFVDKKRNPLMLVDVSVEFLTQALQTAESKSWTNRQFALADFEEKNALGAIRNRFSVDRPCFWLFLGNTLSNLDNPDDFISALNTASHPGDLLFVEVGGYVPSADISKICKANSHRLSRQHPYFRFVSAPFVHLDYFVKSVFEAHTVVANDPPRRVYTVTYDDGKYEDKRVEALHVNSHSAMSLTKLLTKYGKTKCFEQPYVSSNGGQDEHAVYGVAVKGN